MRPFEIIRLAVGVFGSARVARELDTSRANVMGFLSGISRQATRELVESRAHRLVTKHMEAGSK